jgi:phosphatidylglycerophosphate synthase
MRSADAITLLRTLLVFPIAYAILAKYNPVAIILMILVMFVLDSVDGYAAINEASGGKIGFGTYLRSISGYEDARKMVGKYKNNLKRSVYGARIDIAGDRVTEYVLWIVFVYVNIVPLFVLFLVIFRHSFVDAIMGSKGTSSKNKSAFAYKVYSSPIGRGGIGVVKAITFSYLTLVYVSGFPIIIGYALVTVLVGYILLRGIAEVYDNIYA